MCERVDVIAEIGVNHNGSLSLAKELVDAAAMAGADVVKFQTFDAECLVAPQAEMADYQQRNLGARRSQLDMLKGLELPFEAFGELQEYCNKKGVEFMSSPFDENSLAFLVNELKVKRLKIASGEISNGPLLLEFAHTGKALILSTGMSTEKDIDEALSVIAYGLRYPDRQPSGLHDCLAVLAEQESQQLLKENVTLLHCTSQYPAPLSQVNLRAMKSMSERWGLSTGYSDHTDGISVAIAAAAMGASVIEKHFTLDKGMEGPDHAASLEPKEFLMMVQGIRRVELSMGNGIKRPFPVEIEIVKIARKSLVAKHFLPNSALPP